VTRGDPGTHDSVPLMDFVVVEKSGEILGLLPDIVTSDQHAV